MRGLACLILAVIAVVGTSCGGAASSGGDGATPVGARPVPRKAPSDPAAELAEVQAALDEHIAEATAAYDTFVVEAKLTDRVRDAGGSLRAISCEVSITLSVRETGAMIAFAKSSAAVEAPARQVLASRKDCAIGAGRDALRHFEDHFATSVSAFALAAAQSGMRSGALAFN